MLTTQLRRLRFNVQRSKFVPRVERLIQDAGGVVSPEGLAMDFEEEERGYGRFDGPVLVVIDQADREYFKTDWMKEPESRFPARLRATATALRNCRCFGQFIIEHIDGHLTIDLA